MKAKAFFHTLAASVMLAAAAGLTTACTDNDDNPTPGGGGQNQWGAQELTVTVGDMDMKLKLVEGGTYSMPYERDSETKTVTGTLSDYYMAPVEVSNKLWAAVMGAKPEGQTNDGDMYPVSMVNYYDIAGPDGFLARLNAMVKDQLPAGKQLALPTEAQWQYAAMGGKQSKGYKYSGSNTLDDVAWYKDNAGGTTHPIGQKQDNELGLYDMTGNVWEWTRDRFVYFDELPNAQGMDYVCKDESAYRVVRGGAYSSGEDSQPVIHRDWVPMSSRGNYGFRLALVDAYEQETLGDEPITPEKTMRFRVYGEKISAGFTVVEVKGGAYSMQYERDGQTKTVSGTLNDYYINQTEVTNDMWLAVMGTKPEGQTKSGGFYPVSNVTYEDITGPGGFLDRLNEMVKDQLPEGMKLMLPTEAQWHYAAQGGQKSKGYTYAGSNTLGDVAWYVDNANGTTHPVASKQPNELGIYDMSGNVWEWCSDKKDAGNAYAAGGSYTSASDYCKVSATWADDITQGFPNMGFRLVLAAAPQPVAIDMGNGLKWANMNVGARTETDYGDYFAWGETMTYYQEGYSQENPCTHWIGGKTGYNWDSYSLCNGTNTSMIKYCTSDSNGNVDNKTELELERINDAASANWGGNWRTPTDAEWTWLRENCTWTWTTQSGVNGMLVQSNVAGYTDNTIFLPAAGYRYRAGLSSAGSDGYYWSSSLYESYSNLARYVFFSSGGVSGYSDSRIYGLSVRPVQ